MSGNTSGWNRSTGNQPTKRDAKAPSKRKGLVAGLVTIIALVALCLWIFSGNDDGAAASKKKERGRIKEVTPAAAPTNRIAQLAPHKAKVVEVRTNEQGLIMRYEDGKPRWLYPRKPPSRWGTIKINLDEGDQNKSVEDIAMKGMRSTDLFLAYLYNAEPGDEFGDAIPLENFAKRFIKSLETPIIVTHDDPDDVKAIKRGVIELRKELKDRYDAGEDIEAVVKASRDALVEDHQYRKQLEAEITRLSKDGVASVAEMQDFVDAANVMLKEKGLKAVKMSHVIRRRMEKREKLKVQTQQEGN